MGTDDPRPESRGVSLPMETYYRDAGGTDIILRLLVNNKVVRHCLVETHSHSYPLRYNVSPHWV